MKASATTALLLLLVPLQQSATAHSNSNSTKINDSADEDQHSQHSSRTEHASHGEGLNVGADEGAQPEAARDALIPALNAKSASIVRATIELGIVTALGSIFQAWGLARIPATTAGFLIEGKAVMTPALAALAGERISPRTQLASAAALVGALLTAVDGSAAGSGSGAEGAAVALGSAFVLAAAACYSLATFRISVLSPGFRSLDLAAAKNGGIALFSVAFATGAALLASSGAGPSAAAAAVTDAAQTGTAATAPGDPGQLLASLWPGYSNGKAIGLLAWMAAGPGALASVLQVFGQSGVPAAQAQVIFAAIPVWTALISHFVLGEEPLHALGLLGAATIIAAGVSIALETASHQPFSEGG